MAKILVVEDDRNLSEALVYNLRKEDHTPLTAFDAPAAVEMARREKPNLIILDLMLPGGSGLDVCRDIRSFSTAPIIILTARDEDVDRILGLEIGADDYVTKPFSLRELMARVKANLRRVDMDRMQNGDEVVEYGPLRIDLQGRQVTVGSTAVTLQPKEYDLLVYLLQHPGIVLTRDRLLASVWGHDFVGERTVDVHVRRVRAKLEEAGLQHVIRTVHGVGYALNPAVRSDDMGNPDSG